MITAGYFAACLAIGVGPFDVARMRNGLSVELP